MMNFQRIYAVFLRQLFLLRHHPTRFANIFIMIIFDVVLWGFITKYLDTLAHPGFSFVPVLLGAVVLWDFLIRVQQGVMLAFLEDVWSRNFLNYFASPLTIREYVTGLVLTSIVTSVAGFLVMVALAGLIFGYTIFQLGMLLFPFVTILFLFGLTIGIFTAGFVLRFGPSAEWLTWPIPFLINPFVGVFYPVSTLPSILQPMAKLIPPSYVFEGMRSAIFAGKVSIASLLFGLALAIIYLLLAYLFFIYIYRLVLRSGLITRFTAEEL